MDPFLQRRRTHFKTSKKKKVFTVTPGASAKAEEIVVTKGQQDTIKQMENHFVKRSQCSPQCSPQCCCLLPPQCYSLLLPTLVAVLLLSLVARVLLLTPVFRSCSQNASADVFGIVSAALDDKVAQSEKRKQFIDDINAVVSKQNRSFHKYKTKQGALNHYQNGAIKLVVEYAWKDDTPEFGVLKQFREYLQTGEVGKLVAETVAAKLEELWEDADEYVAASALLERIVPIRVVPPLPILALLLGGYFFSSHVTPLPILALLQGLSRSSMRLWRATRPANVQPRVG